ncbi:MAG: isoprenylcysteine carboxylmethyltransferase family protein [Burkholderiales bacterium]|nr:isoprenylcysteine carboxylmethyltransferase family protein [Burkholderiales bacterium]
MQTFYEQLIPALWLAWIAYWIAAARGAKRTLRREGRGSRLAHILPLLLAGWMLWVPRIPLPALMQRFLPEAMWPFWLGVLLTAAGLLFAVWARVHIGRNWSGTVTVKQDHELVTSGPYRFVRHPIYSGLLLAFAGGAIARGEWRGPIAVLIAFVALWRKLGLEERWMREQFGPAYEAYSERVAALLPFLI